MNHTDIQRQDWAAKKMASARNGGLAGANLSALVVDDDPVVRRIHAGYLTKAGFTTQAVENGKQAVDLYRAGKLFDLLLMDLQMPAMDGIQATRALREVGATATIIGISSCNSSDSQQLVDDFKAAGLDDYYAKPLSFDKVALIIKSLNN